MGEYAKLQQRILNSAATCAECGRNARFKVSRMMNPKVEFFACGDHLVKFLDELAALGAANTKVQQIRPRNGA